MHPILLKLGSFTIYSYGFMVALGFGVATFLIYRRADKFGLNPDTVLDLAILILTAGLIGARLFYVMLNFEYYRVSPIEIVNFSKGGLVWYGGFASALLAGVWYMRRKGLNFWKASDLIAPYLALAQSIGRVGCYLNGCCFGLDPHPAQIYSSAALLLLFAILRIWQDKRRFDGEIFLGYCILYPLKRFLMEFVRDDSPKAFYGFTIFQIISAALFLIAVTAFFARALKWKKGSSSSR